MRNLLILITILTTATGCIEYFGVTEFKIINQSSKTIIVRTNIERNDNGIPFHDSIYSVPQGGEIEFSQGLGQVKKDFIPPDNYEPLDSIPPVSRFDIFIENQLTDTLRLRHFWEFSARETFSTYQLIITDKLLDSL